MRILLALLAVSRAFGQTAPPQTFALRDTTGLVTRNMKGRAAKLYVNGSVQPTLVVDGLKGEDLRGAVALWGCANEESYFSNLRITPAAPPLVKSGSDVAGTWSGTLGKGSAVTGTWRDGYVELSFAGEWPPESMGAAGPVTEYLAGWVDGNLAKGRMEAVPTGDGPLSGRTKIGQRA